MVKEHPMAKEFNVIKSFRQTEWHTSNLGAARDGTQGLRIENGNDLKIYAELKYVYHQKITWSYSPSLRWSEKLGLSGKEAELFFELESPEVGGGGLETARYRLHETYPNGEAKTDLAITAKFHTPFAQPPLPYEILLTTSVPAAEDFLRATQYLYESKDLEDKKDHPDGKDKRKRWGWLMISESNYLQGARALKASEIRMCFNGGVLSDIEFQKADPNTLRGAILIERLRKELVLGDPIEKILSQKLIGLDR